MTSNCASTVVTDDLWAILRVGDLSVVAPTTGIEEFIRAPTATPVPHAPPESLGIARWRDGSVFVVDLRRRLGLASRHEEDRALLELLSAREDDHRRWLAELEASTREGRPFTLALDPHACAFGRWYDHYEAPTLELELHLRRFDRPHRDLHGVAARVVALAGEGRQEDALALIDATRDTTLRALIDLFEGARRIIGETDRSIAVVCRGGWRPLALLVDAVEDVGRLTAPAPFALPVTDAARDPAVTGTARFGRDERIVLPLDLGQLARDYGVGD